MIPMAAHQAKNHGISLSQLGRLGETFRAQNGTMALSEQQLRSLSPIALAYLGDAVYELFVRGALLVPPKRIRSYHHLVVSQVRAEQQSSYLQQLLPLLTEAEQDILRRGRNASSRGPKRLDSQIYQQATGFEALIGYLYLTDLDRLVELLGQLEVCEPQNQPSDNDVGG
jgi:ribonuclease-3 family protein